MRNYFNKKTASLLLATLFFVVSFISFASISSAAIADDLKRELALPVTVEQLYGIQEIPEDLDFAQRTEVLDNIVNDAGVKAAIPDVEKTSLAVDSATNDYEKIVLAKSSGTCTAATISSCPVAGIQTDSQVIFFKKALETAISAEKSAVETLRLALVKARRDQKTTIEGMIPVGQASKQTNAVTTAVTTSQTTASGGITNTSTVDAAQAGTQNPVNQANVDATTAKKDALAKFIADEQAGNPGAINGTTVGVGQNGFNNEKDALAVEIHKSCNIWELSFMPCVADVVYYAIYKPASFMLAGAGMIFDFVLMLSIDNSRSMVAPAFIDTAWTVVRDFSNMLFIFVLLYTGIMTMFGMADWKKVVIKVIVVALLINFSLFFTKVVIDAGNVLALGIKSAIGNDSLSAGLVDSFKPQRFLMAAAAADRGSDEALNAIIVFIIASIVSGFAAYYFFKAALLFFGRLIGFWFLMIASPFVFVSTALPAGDQLSKWFQSLIGLTFSAPVFLFLIYLLTMVISAGNGILSQFTQTGTGWFNSLLGPVMAATLVILALKEILSLTEKMAGSFGDMGGEAISVAMKGAGIASGVAAGTAGLAMRGLGAAGAKFGGRGGTLGALGDAASKVSHAGRNATFDVRNIPIPLVGGTVGSHTGAGTGRTSTLNTTKAEAVKRAEEKAKRGEEKPESAGQAIAKAETKRAEAAAKKAARIPEIEKRIDAMKKEAATLSAANGGLVDDALTLQLKANLRAAEATARVREDNAVRNPNDGQAQVDSLRAKRDKESAEKNLKKATSYSDDIEKMEKQLEEYKK